MTSTARTKRLSQRPMPRRRSRWHADLQQRGFHPLLLDSNGRGGYHLLVILAEPVASQRVHAFATQFVQDFAARGLAQAPRGLPQAARRQRATSLWQLGAAAWPPSYAGPLDEGLGRVAVARRPSRRRGDPQRDWRFARLDSSGVSAIVASASVQPRPQYVSAYGTDDWLDILQGTGPGNRHDSLLRLAGFLLGKRLPPEVVEELCVIWNEARNDPPREEEHVRQTVQDLVQRDMATVQSVPVKHGSIGYRRHGNEQYNRNHAGNHHPH